MKFLKKIFGDKFAVDINQKNLPFTSRADEMRIIESLGLQRLNSMPVQAAKAFELACNTKSNLDDFCKVVESDEAISSKIIKIANSVYFRRGEPAKDIISAITNIGLDEIRNLLSATMLKSLLKGSSSYREILWGNSVATAIAAKTLCQYTRISEGEAFLCGLLHDIGKLMFLMRVPVKYEKIIQSYINGQTDILSLEIERLDLSHVELGKWLAEKWGFPESVREAITLHHESWPVSENEIGKNTKSHTLVKCADIISHIHRLGHKSSHSSLAKELEDQKEKIQHQLKIDKETLERLGREISNQFNSEISLYEVGDN